MSKARRRKATGPGGDALTWALLLGVGGFALYQGWREYHEAHEAKTAGAGTPATPATPGTVVADIGLGPVTAPKSDVSTMPVNPGTTAPLSVGGGNSYVPPSQQVIPPDVVLEPRPLLGFKATPTSGPVSSIPGGGGNASTQPVLRALDAAGWASGGSAQ